MLRPLLKGKHIIPTNCPHDVLGLLHDCYKDVFCITGIVKNLASETCNSEVTLHRISHPSGNLLIIVVQE